MAKESDTCSCRLTGPVIETFEVGGRKVVRLAVSGGTIDIEAGLVDGAHLGDAMLIEGTLTAFKVTPQPDPPFFSAPSPPLSGR
mgnify:CR=1 FL=1